MNAPFFLIRAPLTVTVTPGPTTNELANKSNNPINKFPKYRFSPNGRRLLADINDQPFDLNSARRVLSDVYPPGIDPTIDAAQREGSDGTPPGHYTP